MKVNKQKTIDELREFYLEIFPDHFEKWFCRMPGTEWDTKPVELVRTGRINMLFEFLENIKNNPSEREKLWTLIKEWKA